MFSLSHNSKGAEEVVGVSPGSTFPCGCCTLIDIEEHDVEADGSRLTDELSNDSPDGELR